MLYYLQRLSERLTQRLVKRPQLHFAALALGVWLAGYGVATAQVTIIGSPTNYTGIQAAVNAASPGDVVSVAAGTYDELVIINKGLTIQGQGATSNITFTGTVPGSALASLFTVAAADVTIQNLGFTVDLSKTHSAIHTTGNDRTNLHVIGNKINPVGTPAGGTYGRRNAIAINPNASVPNYALDNDGFGGVVVQSNTVTAGSSGLSNTFRAAVHFDLGGGVIGGATASQGNSFTAINHDFISAFANQGDLTVQNNTFGGGGVQISDPNPNAGIITVSNNTLDGSFVQPATGALGTGALMRIRNNGISGVKTLLVQNNTFTNQRWGISSENNGGITISGNSFTPNAAATDFRHISINTKLIASNSASLTDAQMQTLNATLTGNTFNSASTPGSGTAVAFLNHRTAGANFGTFTFGTLGNENTFNAGIGTFVMLDNSAGASTAYAGPLGDYAGIPATNMGSWAVDISGYNNKFDVGSGPKIPQAMTGAERTTLETKLFHKPDDATVGRILYFYPVRNVTQSLSYTAIQPAIDAANANDVIELAEYTFNERVSITKPLTLTGISKTNTIIDGTGLSGTGSGIALNSGVTNVTIKNLTVRNFAGVSPNSSAGIYGALGNSNLLVDNVQSLSNVGGAGFYANGPVQGVTITNSTFSGHTGGARGIVIWNGFKQNIVISNNIVTNNNCCGIELQDGTASGVTITGNTVLNNADNGIGVIGLKAGAGPTLIANNILNNNGRFGIEIKNPNGTGLTSGDGSIVIENNTVSLTATVGMNNRDHAGISVYRRGVLVNNSEGYPDVPTGVVVRNNTVSGYQHLNQVSAPTESEGFGIVVEGTNHTVTGNTLNNNNIGVQQQGGGHPNANYVMNNSGDGDQAAGQSPGYFGRGNAAVACGNTVSGNNFSGNTTNTRNAGPGAGKPELVKNLTTGSVFCTIQSAVNAATSGQSLSVGAGTYNEQVLVNKSLTISGNSASKPVINFTGTPALASSRLTLFEVTAPNVTIQNLSFTPDLTKVGSAILASVAQPGSVSALTVSNNDIAPYRSAGLVSYGLRNAISINYGAYRVNASAPGNLLISGNTISYNDGGTPGNAADDAGFRSGIATDEGGGSFTGNTIQTINQDIQVRFGLAGAISVTNNNINGGGVELAEQNGAAGPITVTGNMLNGTFGNTFSSSLRLKNNTNAIPTTVSSNTFTGHNWGVSLENYRAVAVNNNTFTPATGSTTYRHVTVDTKELSSSSGFFTPAVSLTLLGNTFTGSSSPTSGTALVFYNQDNDSPTFGPFVIGTAGNENSFAASLGTFIALDGSTGTVAPNGTQAAPFATNMNIANNRFDVGSGLQLPKDMSVSERATLETKLLHKPDNAALGLLSYFFPVQNVTQNLFYETIQLAVDAATAGDVLLAPAGTYPESVTINKAITLNGANAGVNPNTGTRTAETIIQSLTGNDAIITLFTGANNVTIKGITLDGTNLANDATGIETYNEVVNGLTVENNIIQNVGGYGVDLYSTGTPTDGHQIVRNRFVNLAGNAGIAVLLYNNAYATVSENVMRQVNRGVQTGNFYQPKPTGSAVDIANNNIQTNTVGIYHNLQYGTATQFQIHDNTIAPVPGSTPSTGIQLYSIQTAVNAIVSSNTVTAGFQYGARVWNTPSTGSVVFTQNNWRGSVEGIRFSNVNNFGDASTGSQLRIQGDVITGSPVGIRILDDAANTNGASLSATINQNTSITGTGTFTAVSVGGSDATATISQNTASFVGNGSGTGIDINGGTATVSQNRIENFGVGINVSNGGKLGTTVNNFLTNNQTTGIRFAADAATTGQGPVNDNSITTTATGTGRAIQNASGAGIAATCNWLGSVTALSPAYVQNTGAGSLTYTPTRVGGTDDATGPSNGFQPQDACVCPVPTVVASATGICVGSSVTLTASGAASYTWSTGETTASIVVTPTSTTTISLTATNEGGCVSTTAVTVTVNNLPTMPTLTPASSTLTCAITSVTLTASATGGASYTLLGGASSQSNTTGQFVVSMAGNYTAIIANASGCTATATATVTSNTAAPTATLTASTSPVCAPASVTITAGGTGTSFTFSAGATQIGMTNQAIVTQSGTYSVTVSNANGCTATASVSVTVNTPPAAPTLTAVSRTVTQSNTPLPLGQFVSATGTLSFSGVNGLLNPPNANISQLGVQSFSVTQTDVNGCTSSATPFSLTVVPIPTSPGSQTVCRSSQVVLPAGAVGTRYEWYKNGQTAPFKMTEIASIQKGTTTSSLTLVSVQTTANYYCKVFQANGSFVFTGPFAVVVNYGCVAPGARVAATEVAEVSLSVVLTPNPLIDGQLRAVVRGAAGQSLSVQLVDLRGQVVRAQQWAEAENEQVVDWNINQQSTGMYLLQAQAGNQIKTIKVIHR